MPPELRVLPLPTPFPVGPVNVYLAEGEPLTLIDAGPKYEPARQALQAGLAGLGYRMEDLQQLILTHHHVDHLGLAAEIVARSGAEVFTHAFNLPWLENFAARFDRDAEYYKRFYRENGVPQNVMSAIDAVRKNVSLFAGPVRSAVHVIDEGDVLAFAGQKWQIFHTPGHAGGLICLWEKESQTLLCNDHLLRDVSSNAIMEPPASENEPRPKRLVEYLHHLHRMAELHPQLALPGHGPAITNFCELVRERAAFHRLRAQTILEILHERPHTLWELTQALFPALSNGVDWFLGLSEAQGHLDWLEQEGKLNMIQGPFLQWRYPAREFDSRAEIAEKP